MSMTVLTRNYPPPPVSEKEILRYAGCRSADHAVSELMHSCLDEIKSLLNCRVCWCELPVLINGDQCCFELFELRSKKLAANLAPCSRVVLFAATIGIGIDRVIAKYNLASPSKAVMLQAIGAERIEALCDSFCHDIAKEYKSITMPRFSPGYGDLPLETQLDIFALLDCPKRIGVSLNSSLLMAPSKSVTAFVGLVDK